MNDFPITDDTYVPRTQPSLGRQLLAIYFGSPTCGYCVHAPFIASIRRAGALIQRQAAALGLTLHWSGVAVHWSAAEGIEYLAKLGPFDEVCAGAMWWNTSVAHHLYGSRPPAVPTLVVYERTIEADATHALQLRDQHELLRLTGSKAIEEWIAIGAPVDALRSSNLDGGNSAT